MPKLLGMSYTREGSGKDVLLLHGWGSNKECFNLLIRRLSLKYRVTAVDLYGFGKSDMPPEPFSLRDYADRIAFFCGLAEIRPYAVLGHSFGGRVAVKLLSDNPEFSAKLVLVDSAGLPPKRGVKYRVKTACYKLLKKLPFVDREKLAGRFASPDYAAASPVMRETMKKAVNEDLTDALARIRAETLLLWGERDEDTPPEMGRRFERGIAGAGLVVIEGAGHFSFIDKPHYFLRVLENFLSG